MAEISEDTLRRLEYALTHAIAAHRTREGLCTTDEQIERQKGLSSNCAVLLRDLAGARKVKS